MREHFPSPGVVVNVGDYGVFADIGYEQNAILAIPRRPDPFGDAAVAALSLAHVVVAKK